MSSSQPRRGRLFAVVAAVLVLALLAGFGVVQYRQKQERLEDVAATDAARSFAAAAQQGDLTPAALADLAPAQAQEQYAALVKGLRGAKPAVEVTAVRRTGDTGTADLRWSWPFGPDGWNYTTQAPLTKGGGDGPWSVRWSAPVVHPGLAVGDVLTATRTAAPRGEVLGRAGTPIVANTGVVEVGVQPSRAPDPVALTTTLADLLDVEQAPLLQRVRSAGPDAFVPVITLRRSDYDPLRSRLQPLPGVVFRESMLPLAPSRAFARALLGTAGPATAELVESSGGRLAAGDTTGLSGLQRAYDTRLAGSPATRVEQVRGTQRTELFAVPAVPGSPLRLTLDPKVQQAADTALAGAVGGNGNASLVAIDVPTGNVLAVANTPANGADRASTGRYPPGSTFKTATTLALLGDGLGPEEAVNCPPTITVNGRSIRNFEGGALGSVPFRTAFAQSCNTAFVGLAERLDPPDIPAAAASLGIGTPWKVGIGVFAGDAPAPTTPVEKAATAIGQAKVLVSPAALAQLAATIARGSYAPPHLVTDPDPGPAPAAPPAADSAALATVRDLMRQVVLTGSGNALADVPGLPVHAKTGTAEFGTDSPPRTHAWTIGFQGDLAFAVLVEDGKSGGGVAVPVVEAFLRTR